MTLIKAAGILLLDTKKNALFLKRGPGGDCPGMWCIPGGRVEDGESDIQAAVRETFEECGFRADESKLSYWTRQTANRETTGAEPTPPPAPSASPVAAPAPVVQIEPNGVAVLGGDKVDFTTFAMTEVEQFIPDLAKSGEHVAYAWAPVDQPPEPLHPGCRVALARITMDELGVAEAMRDGQLTSPQPYANMTLFNIRITGTGGSYRAKLNEYVWRDPSIYMNERFRQRCNGLPVILEHPKGSTLDTKEYKDRAIGSVMLPYLNHEAQEVWAIARIQDQSAAKIMAEEQLSTSPAVILKGPDANTKLTADDGSIFLLEGKPFLLDHIAICERGVWDKNGPPAGVISTTIINTEGIAMADDDKYTKVVDKKADADGGSPLDKMLKGIEAMTAKIDSLGARMDSIEDMNKAKKADADDDDDKKKSDADDADDDKKKDSDDDKPNPVMADKAKKDSAKKADADDDKEKADADDDDKKADAARADSNVVEALMATVSSLTDRVASLTRDMPKPLSDKDYVSFADAQSKADQVLAVFADSAPRPMQGESVLAYRRRLAGMLQKHSPTWSKVDLGVAIVDEALMAVAESQIYAEAYTAGKNPKSVPNGGLRGVKKTTGTGHGITEFIGSPKAWMSRHAPSGKAVVAFNLTHGK